jgi:trimethylamine--corrinoid protein Co-methyltransferase
MDEVAGLVKRFLGGIELNTDTIALDVIDQVGPGGHYLEHAHTYKHFKKNWVPKLFDRTSREQWESEGQLTMGDKTTAKVRNILESHQVEPLTDNVSKTLDTIIQKAEERVK